MNRAERSAFSGQLSTGIGLGAFLAELTYWGAAPVRAFAIPEEEMSR